MFVRTPIKGLLLSLCILHFFMAISPPINAPNIPPTPYCYCEADQCSCQFNNEPCGPALFVPNYVSAILTRIPCFTPGSEHALTTLQTQIILPAPISHTTHLYKQFRSLNPSPFSPNYVSYVLLRPPQPHIYFSFS